MMICLPPLPCTPPLRYTPLLLCTSLLPYAPPPPSRPKLGCPSPKQAVANKNLLNQRQQLQQLCQWLSTTLVRETPTTTACRLMNTT
ncbi:hypothetical protein ACQ4LE_007482 [Meloidogyne hapla]